MKYAELREKMTARLKELDDLAGKTDRSAEEEARVDALLAEVNDLGPQIDRQRDIESAVSRRAEFEAPAGTRASGLAERPDAAERVHAPHTSPMRRFLDSQEYKSALNHPKSISQPVDIGSFHRRGGAWQAEDGPTSPEELRAVIHSGVPSASMLLPQVVPGVFRAGEAPLVMRDVLVNAQTSSDAITFMEESGFTNSAAEVAEATATNGVGLTGGVKPESALTFTETTVPVRWIAHWMPLTRQLLEDLPAMRSYVEERLVTGLRRREDNQLLNGNGTAPNISGILNNSGIQTLDGTYFTANPVVGVGTARENFDRTLRAKTLIQTVAKAQASFVVVNPGAYERMQSFADANGQYYAGGPFSAGGVPTLWGLPVVQSENIANNRALVGDGLMAAIFDRHDARIYTTDSHADFFIRNLIVILAEERLALAVFRPAAFAHVTLV